MIFESLNSSFYTFHYLLTRPVPRGDNWSAFILESLKWIWVRCCSMNCHISIRKQLIRNENGVSEDPKRFSDCNHSILDYDSNIFEGLGYQTGTEADFSEHQGWAIWHPDVKSIFLREMREIAKKHHGTRIKDIQVDNNLDHVDLTITY